MFFIACIAALTSAALLLTAMGLSSKTRRAHDPNPANSFKVAGAGAGLVAVVAFVLSMVQA